MPQAAVLDSVFPALSATAAWELASIALILLIAGIAVGFLAGLFGVGGGTVAVPVLYEAFGWLQVDDAVRMPLCVGTSLAVIIPTSIASYAAHKRRGHIDMDLLKLWVIPILIGVAAGSLVASIASAAVFKLAFVAIALVTVVRLLWASKLPVSCAELRRGRPLTGYGLTIGAFSSLVGIGGGILATLVMTLHGRAIHQAVATSSGVGLLVSLPGTLGYMIVGWDKTGLPPLSLGFVSVTGLLLLMPASVATAKAGAWMAHKLSPAQLNYAFAGYLLVVSCRFCFSLIGS